MFIERAHVVIKLQQSRKTRKRLVQRKKKKTTTSQKWEKTDQSGKKLTLSGKTILGTPFKG